MSIIRFHWTLHYLCQGITKAWILQIWDQLAGLISNQLIRRLISLNLLKKNRCGCFKNGVIKYRRTTAIKARHLAAKRWRMSQVMPALKGNAETHWVYLALALITGLDQCSNLEFRKKNQSKLTLISMRAFKNFWIGMASIRLEYLKKIGKGKSWIQNLETQCVR